MLLAEEFLILGLDDKSGKISASAAGSMNIAIAGALLMDLAFRDAIRIHNKEIIINEHALIDDPLLEDILEDITLLKDQQDLEFWISRLSKQYSHFQQNIFRQLKQDEILGHHEEERLKIFRNVRYPLLYPEIKENLLSVIQQVLLNERAPDDRIISILCLIKSCNLIHTLFNKNFENKAIEKIDIIINSYITDETVKEIVESIENAILHLTTSPQIM